MPQRGEWARSGKREIFVPDVQIQNDDPTYAYLPLNGYSASLAVFDVDDNVIGWIDTRTLGYESAREWMVANKYIPAPSSRGRRRRR